MIIRVNGQILQGMLIVELNYPGVGVKVSAEQLEYAAASVTIRAHGNGSIREPLELGIVQLLVSYIRVEQYDGLFLRDQREKSEDALYDCEESRHWPWYSESTHACFGQALSVTNRPIRFDFEMKDDPGGEVDRSIYYKNKWKELTKLWESAEFVVALIARHNQRIYVVDQQRWNYRFHCTMDETGQTAEIDWSRSWMGTAPLFENMPRIDQRNRIANDVPPKWKLKTGEFEGW